MQPSVAVQACCHELIESITRHDFADIVSTAQLAHLNQTRRDGRPYIVHPLEVLRIVRQFYPDDRRTQLVAVLHDAMEDGIENFGSLDELESHVIGSISDQAEAEAVLDVVRLLTHSSSQSYVGYVVGLLGHRTALRVKLADMLNNLSESPSPNQLKKYAAAIRRLELVGGSPPSGISIQHWAKLKRLIVNVAEARCSLVGMLI